MGTPFVWQIQHSHTIRHANREPDTRSRHGESGGSQTERQQPECMCQRTVLAKPSWTEKGDKKPNSLSTFAELTLKEPVIFRKSSERIPPRRTIAAGIGRKRGRFPNSLEITEKIAFMEQSSLSFSMYTAAPAGALFNIMSMPATTFST